MRQLHQPIALRVSNLGFWVAVTIVGTLPLPINPALAQPTVDALPPPPPFQPLEASPTPSPSAPFTPIEQTFQATPMPPEVTPISYRVIVNGDSPLLLQQVQRLEPQAFVARHREQPVIQVGAFTQESNARQKIAMLQAQGIQAEIVTATPSSGFFVVIPGKREDLPGIRDRVLQLGIEGGKVTEQESPLGPHVRVGPFESRVTADSQKQLLRESGGLDARLYYQR